MNPSDEPVPSPRNPARDDREQRCTAPHPIVPFLYFVATVLAVGLAIYWFIAD